MLLSTCHPKWEDDNNKSSFTTTTSSSSNSSRNIIIIIIIIIIISSSTTTARLDVHVQRARLLDRRKYAGASIVRFRYRRVIRCGGGCVGGSLVKLIHEIRLPN